jgi:hypothetical protein
MEPFIISAAVPISVSGTLRAVLASSFSVAAWNVTLADKYPHAPATRLTLRATGGRDRASAFAA